MCGSPFKRRACNSNIFNPLLRPRATDWEHVAEMTKHKRPRARVTASKSGGAVVPSTSAPPPGVFDVCIQEFEADVEDGDMRVALAYSASLREINRRRALQPRVDSRVQCREHDFVFDENLEEHTCKVCGFVHVCGQSGCDALCINVESTLVCSKTGFCFGQVAPPHRFSQPVGACSLTIAGSSRCADPNKMERAYTHCLRPRDVELRAHRSVQRWQKLRGEAERTIKVLLDSPQRTACAAFYDTSYRTRIICEYKRRVKKERRRGTPPNLHHFLDLLFDCKRAVVVRRAPLTAEIVERYTNMVLELWRITTNTTQSAGARSAIMFTHHTVAALYCMRRGVLEPAAGVNIPSDAWLQAYLPPILSLGTFFGLKRVHTIGRKKFLRGIRQLALNRGRADAVAFGLPS